MFNQTPSANTPPFVDPATAAAAAAVAAAGAVPVLVPAQLGGGAGTVRVAGPAAFFVTDGMAVLDPLAVAHTHGTPPPAVYGLYGPADAAALRIPLAAPPLPYAVPPHFVAHDGYQPTPLPFVDLRQQMLQHYQTPLLHHTPIPLSPYVVGHPHAPAGPLLVEHAVLHHHARAHAWDASHSAMAQAAAAQAAALAAAAVAPPAPPPVAPTGGDALRQALALAHDQYNAGAFREAYGQLLELHASYPWHLPTLLLLGCTCYSLGLYEQSLAYNNAILAIDPQFSEAYSNQGTVYRAMGGAANVALAKNCYRMALRLRPNYWDASVNLAGLLSTESAWREALEVYGALEEATGEPWRAIHGDGRGLGPDGEPTPWIQRAGEGGAGDVALAAALVSAQSAPAETPAGVSPLSPEHRRDLYLAKGNLYFALNEVGCAKTAYFEALTAVGIDLAGLLASASSGQLPRPLLTPEQAAALLGDAQRRHLPAHHVNTSSVLQSLAKIYQDAQQPHVAAAVYYASLAALPMANTCNNLGILLASQRLDESIAWYRFGLTLEPHHVHLLTNLGSALKDQGRVQDGIQCYESAIAAQPDFYIALANLANVYKDLGRVEEAIVLYRRALKVKPDFVEAFCNYANSLMFVCDWTDRAAHLLQIRLSVAKQLDEVAAGDGAVASPRPVPTVLPFHTFTYSSLSCVMVREISRRNAERVRWNVSTATWFRGFAPRALRMLEAAGEGSVRVRASLLGSGGGSDAGLPPALAAALDRALHYPYPSPPPLTEPQLRIGYVSSDFNNHPLAHLMQSVFGMHDRTRFRVYCYAVSAPDGSAYRAKIEAGADVFVDASALSVEQLVARISMVDRIHILVNLNGYTKGGRHEVFAARPAPLTMTFMGFAGTMGAGRPDDVPVAPGEEGVSTAPGVLRGEERAVGSRSQGEWEQAAFFDDMPVRWMDYFVVDQVACPRRFVCGEPLDGNEDLAAVETLDATQVGKGGSRLVLARGPIAADSDANRMYTERLVYMPWTYFVNDHRQGFREPADADVDPLCALLARNDSSVDAEDAEDELSPDEQSQWRAEMLRRLKMRRELFPQLPEDTVILANFNQLYKVDPLVLHTWLRILERVPNAVLWLLRFPRAGEAHIRAEAARVAGPHVAARIVFTDVAAKHEHVHRGRVADLFLDTPECNAHTTAADILWSGTPVVTYAKYDFKMCSRVATSIALAAGSWRTPAERSRFSYSGRVPKDVYPRAAADQSLLGLWMVVDSYYEYEERAVLLASSVQWGWRALRPLSSSPDATVLPLHSVVAPFYSSESRTFGQRLLPLGPPSGPGPPPVAAPLPYPALDTTHIFVPLVADSLLLRLRRALFLSRDSCPLFDTPQWVRDLERGMLLAWQRWEAEWAVVVSRNAREVARVAAVARAQLASNGRGVPVSPSDVSGDALSVAPVYSRRRTSRCLWV